MTNNSDNVGAMNVRHGRVLAAALVSAAVFTVSGCTVNTDDSTPAVSEQPVRTKASSPSAATSTTTTSAAPVAEPFKDAPGKPCGTELLSKLSTRQKLAQMLTVGVTGTTDALHVVSHEQVGGIMYGSWTDSSMLNAATMQQIRDAGVPKLPALVSTDEEGGRVSRLASLIGSAPSARDLASSMSEDQVYDLTRTRAKAMRDLGITVDFAPVVDVSSHGSDTVIGDRSFSDDPGTVSRYARKVIDAMHDEDVRTVIKHFPGHGSGSGDSHTGAVTTPPLDQLIEQDLKPFATLVDSGSAVMVGHLDVPGLTADGEPTSISPATMKLLREGKGYGAKSFDGVIFTDDLGSMAAMTSRYGIVEAVEKALVAGADIALWITTDAVGDVLTNLEDAVATGRLPMAQVDKSVVRIGRYKGVLACS